MSECPKIAKTVLLVEDDESIREIMQMALEDEGYSVLSAANGKIGLEILEHFPELNLVLLDMMMPVMNGRQFLDEVARSRTLKNVPIVVVSATSDRKQMEGAKALIRKPTDLSSLLKAVANYCMDIPATT
jgi:CheY-like chemotaxis protein